jgi:hypothetical protein
MSIIDRIMNRAPRLERNELNEVDVRFHKEANHHRIHGYLVVTHRQLGIREGAVAFSFPNFSDAPDLDMRLMYDLFEAAKSQGFIPHRLAAYDALEPMPAVQEATPAAANVGLTKPWASEKNFVEPRPDLRRLQSVPAVARKQAPGNGTFLKELSDIHASWAAAVEDMDPQDREALEILLDQIMSNGRAMKYDNATIVKKVGEAYRKTFPDIAKARDRFDALDATKASDGGEGVVQLKFSRADDATPQQPGTN